MASFGRYFDRDRLLVSPPMLAFNPLPRSLILLALE
jgi:hypothetical protein